MSNDTKQGWLWRHSGLSDGDLAALLKARIPDDEQAWYVVTRINDRDFFEFDKQKAEELIAAWTESRVFCKSCEIRWRRPCGETAIEVFILSEDPAPAPAGFQPVGQNWRVIKPGEQAHLVPWGSKPVGRDDNIRAESRLPRELSYPKSCKPQVRSPGKLKCLYYCAQSGELQLIRLTEVE
jgi:hypothetical protein